MNYLCGDFMLNLQWYVANSENGREASLDTHRTLSSFQKISSNNIGNMLTDRTPGSAEISLTAKYLTKMENGITCVKFKMSILPQTVKKTHKCH